MKIDCHIHITPPDLMHMSKALQEKEPYFAWLSTSKNNHFATGDQVVRQLDEAGFDKGVVFGFAFRDPELCRYVNDYTIEQVNKYPDRLIGFMVINPNDPEMEKEVERCVKAGLKGIGELFPEGQQFDLNTIHQTSALGKCCEKYQLPLLLHTNETVGHEYVGKTKVTLKEVENFITQHSKTPIILAHLGGGMMFFESMKEIRGLCENVYYDTAALLFLYDPQIYQVARQLGVEDKILFGSDYPLVSIKRYEKGFFEGGVDTPYKEKIQGKNIEKILDIKDVISC